jgi:Xaa-Pro aminopeptidase
MSTTMPRPVTDAAALINAPRLRAKLAAAGIDVLLATAPENSYYLSGVFIRTQISIRERLALVIWPLDAAPTFVVCNIEESLARAEGSIADVRTYVEHAETPMSRVVDVLNERGLGRLRIGIERNYIPASAFEELRRGVPEADFVGADALIESVRSVKTEAETSRITDAFLRTEAAIRDAWGRSGAGDTEKTVADRMLFSMLGHGASGLRHMTLASGENTVHAHMTPADRRLRPGDTVLTDTGAHFYGFSSDMARMGIVGTPTKERMDEYTRYREVYVELLHFIRPGITAADVYAHCNAAYATAGLPMTSPHVGHSLTRMAGHENPILHPGCDLPLEAGMLLAVEPSFKPRPDQRYHIEDLVQVTETGSRILTDWSSTDRMIEFAAGSR